MRERLDFLECDAASSDNKMISLAKAAARFGICLGSATLVKLPHWCSHRDHKQSIGARCDSAAAWCVYPSTMHSKPSADHAQVAGAACGRSWDFPRMRRAAPFRPSSSANRSNAPIRARLELTNNVTLRRIHKLVSACEQTLRSARFQASVRRWR